jgi:hypothetical protein
MNINVNKSSCSSLFFALILLVLFGLFIFSSFILPKKKYNSIIRVFLLNFFAVGS